ncbi:hypothetical protein N8306_04175 [Yoonia sp.]|nr:hypothetical protein [Yoonia sp.]
MQPKRAIITQPGQDDANCPLLLIDSKRTEETVDRLAVAQRRVNLQQPQTSLFDRQADVFGHDMNNPSLDRVAILDDLDRQRREVAYDIV